MASKRVITLIVIAGGKLSTPLKHAGAGKVAWLCALFFVATAHAQQPASSGDSGTPAPSSSNDRILGVIPNYQTVSDPNQNVAPLTVKQKFQLFFGAAVADITTQNFFSDAVLSSLLHEDPRYFRRGPEFPFWHRLGYAMSRVVVGRTDSGKEIFNYAGIGGMALGIGLSNAYYPNRSVNGTEVATRFGTSLVAAALSNILPEFWPDIKQKVFHHK